MKKLVWLLTLIVVLSLSLSACGGSTAAPEEAAAMEPFRVAVVMPSAINDLAFSQSMYDALLLIQEEMGGPEMFEIVYSENMFVVDDAAAAIRDYASQGYDLVIGHGSQYGSSLQEIAPDFPETSFACAILAQQGMDFAAFHVKVDMVTGKHARETFGDAAHFKTVDAFLSGGKQV